MKPRSIVILQPTRGTCSDAHADCYARLSIACASRGIALFRQTREIPGLLEHARNTLCGDVLDATEQPTAYLWLDTDVHFNPDLVFDSLDRPEALIARAYPQRQPNFPRLAELLANGGRRDEEGLRHAAYSFGVGLQFRDGKPAWSEDGKLVEVRMLGFGWVMIKGEPFLNFLRYLAGSAERDASEFFTRTWILPDWRKKEELTKLLLTYQRMLWKDFAHRTSIGAFQFCHIDGVPIEGGEDTSFFYRWRTWNGAGPVWLDPWEPVGNGNKTGAYIDYMRETFGPSRAELGLPLSAPIGSLSPAARGNGQESSTLPAGT